MPNRKLSAQIERIVNGHLKLPIGGHESCPLVANKNCPVADTNLPVLGMSATGGSLDWSAQGFDPLSVQGLGQSDGITAGLAQVGVVQ